MIASLLVSLGCVVTSFGQPETIGWILNNPSPGYLLSADETRLTFFDRTADDKTWAKVLDLPSWQWGITPILHNVHLTADNKSGYQLWYAMEGKPAEGGLAGYKKYVTNVYTDLPSASFKRTQWPDQNLVIASMPDGNLLVADKVSFESDKKAGGWKAKIRGLKIVTLSGAVVRSLRPDFTREAPLGELTKFRVVTPDGRWLMWPGHSFGMMDVVPLEGGETRQIKVPHAGIQGFAGQYLVSIGRSTPAGFDGYRDNRKILIDLATGRTVYDVVVAQKTDFNLWGAASRDGSIYTLDEVTMELIEETWKDGALVRVSARTLEGDNLSLTSSAWGNRPAFFVSKPADKVLVLPKDYTNGKAHNEAYVWQLSTGKMLYRAPNYIRPHAAYLATLYAPPPPPRTPAVAIGPNMLVQNGGRLYHLRELSYSGQWVTTTLTRNRHGFFEREDALKPGNFFSPVTTRVISTTACPACAGGGTRRVNERRTTETKAEMIYNTLVTTKTETVQANHVCEACKGSGFQF